MIRKPIVTVMGHVDHGKTKLLDTIRKTTVQDMEAGAITQAIGASIVPLDTIKRLCGDLLKKLKLDLKIPGLLFIDTPGHEIFANLRKRGGSLADIAIIVIDINEGCKPQTIEAIEILKQCKTPFIIALNKVDLINGWKISDKPLLQQIEEQNEKTKNDLSNKMYEIVGRLYELGFQAERFDKVDDYTKQIALVPISAKLSIGIGELLMVLSGLVQRYLSKNIQTELSNKGRGTVLEVKEEKGLGKTIDVIVYDGTIKVNDTIVIGGINMPIVTKVRALFEPAPLSEMRDKRSKFKSVKEVHAATGVKISAPDIEGAVAGMPIIVANEDIEHIKEELQKEIEQVIITTGEKGVIVKSDSLGSLEALVNLLKQKNIPICKASIGEISKKDIIEAQAVKESSPLLGVVLGFNVSLLKDAEEFMLSTGVKVITNNVIYKLLDDYNIWVKEEKAKEEKQQSAAMTLPCKLKIMSEYIFRQSNPAIFGAEILAGTLKTGVRLMKEDGTVLGIVKSIKEGKENVSEAKSHSQMPISVMGAVFGRNIESNDTLYVVLTENEFIEYKERKDVLKNEEKQVLKETASIMRKKNPAWGV